ncbi:MAG: nitroreductase family protein [Clostridiales bacterium]|nr:nitroreductase family protein [Clostridiales bacterium]
MILAATDEGLGTCWVGWFEQDVVRKILNIPSNLEVPILVSIGFAAENPSARARKAVNELVAVV